jgi:hypothetical protein
MAGALALRVGVLASGKTAGVLKVPSFLRLAIVAGL